MKRSRSSLPVVVEGTRSASQVRAALLAALACVHLGNHASAQVTFDAQLLEQAVFQRGNDNSAAIPVSGQANVAFERIEARATPRSGFSGIDSGWQTIVGASSPGGFSGALDATAGWYDVELRALDAAGAVIATQTVPRVGVGEVFITAGQSNSVNAGETPQTPEDERVAALNFDGWLQGQPDPTAGVVPGTWQFAQDPQPVGGQFGQDVASFGGSPWPAMGDALAAALDVPIGFLSTGAGGSYVDDWSVSADYDPTQNFLNIPSLYETNLKPAIQELQRSGGFRAILYHQGESDSISFTPTATYQSSLESLIAQSRNDAAYDGPWAVAIASSYLTGASANNVGEAGGAAAVAAAQQNVIAGDPTVFQGANTDTLGAEFRPVEDFGSFVQQVHFTAEGLALHGQLWANALLEQGVVGDGDGSPGLLSNAGFEFGLGASWDNFGLGATVVDDVERGMVLTSDPASGVFHTPIDLEAGDYIVHFLARASAAGAEVFSGISGAGEEDSDTGFLLTEEWQPYTWGFSLTEASSVQAWIWGAVDGPTAVGEYFVDDVILAGVTNPTPGDFNRDGVVDEGDYSMWLSQYSATGSQLADANGDGLVDAADYTLWRDQFTQATSTPVPEPAALAATCAAIALTLAPLGRANRPRTARRLLRLGWQDSRPLRRPVHAARRCFPDTFSQRGRP